MQIFLLVLLKQQAEQFSIQAERALTVQLVISGKELATFVQEKNKKQNTKTVYFYWTEGSNEM